MKLDRPLLIFDLETTGVDVCADRIVELGVSVLHPDGTVKPNGWSVRMNPGIPIPAAAIEVHGITDADVSGCHPFAFYAAKLHASFQGKDIATYNGRRLDLPILDEEMRRCGLKLNLDGVRLVDAAGIFFKREPRDLSAAVQRYCGRDHADAHGAGADAAATLEVLQGQLKAYPDLDTMSLDDLAAYSRLGDNEPIDLAGKLYRDPEGFARFAFGKNKDKRVIEERGYCDWIFTKGNFPGSTLDALRVELQKKS